MVNTRRGGVNRKKKQTKKNKLNSFSLLVLIFNFFFVTKWENKMCDLKTGSWKNLEEKKKTKNAKGKRRAWFVFPFEIKHWRWPEVVIANCTEKSGSHTKMYLLKFKLWLFHFFFPTSRTCFSIRSGRYFFRDSSPRLIDDRRFLHDPGREPEAWINIHCWSFVSYLVWNSNEGVKKKKRKEKSRCHEAILEFNVWHTQKKKKK